MNFSIGPFSFSFKSRLINDESLIKMSDINYINNYYLNYIKKLPKKNLLSRLDTISIDRLQDIKAARRILKDEGVLVVRNFISKQLISKLENSLKDINNVIYEFTKKNILISENNNLLIQKKSHKLKKYDELSSYKKTVFNLRSNQDEGMIDVFNVNFAYPEIGSIIDNEKQQFLCDLVAENNKIKVNNLNLYINESITRTRGFHVDAYSFQLKSFIYLTDCLDLNDGPYTYVKKSHLNKIYKKFNINISESLKNNTESPFLIAENITPLLSEKGTLIVSNQAGIHRGFPQGKGHNRIVLVQKHN